MGLRGAVRLVCAMGRAPLIAARAAWSVYKSQHQLPTKKEIQFCLICDATEVEFTDREQVASLAWMRNRRSPVGRKSRMALLGVDLRLVLCTRPFKGLDRQLRDSYVVLGRACRRVVGNPLYERGGKLHWS